MRYGSITGLAVAALLVGSMPAHAMNYTLRITPNGAQSSRLNQGIYSEARYDPEAALAAQRETHSKNTKDYWPDRPVSIIMPNSAGMPSCGSWTVARKNPSNEGAYQYEKWMWGFLSGLNFAWVDTRGDVLWGIDPDGLSAWIDQYCIAHPLNNLAQASMALDQELARRHLAR